MTEGHEHQPRDVAVANKRSRTPQAAIPAVYMRGGTSKGLFLHERDLPPPGAERDALILELMGTPDPLQIDGMGGSHSSSSKVVIVAPSTRPDADVEYLFVQVGVDLPSVSVDGNCGNLTAAVGPFAVDEGLVPASDPTTLVRLWNRNTAKLINAHVPTEGGRAAVTGDHVVAGIPRSGAPITTEFRWPACSVFPALYPSGSPADRWEVDGLGAIDVSIIDVASPYLFVHASAFGLAGTESPAELNQDLALLALLERVRATAAVRLGRASTLEEATVAAPAVPRIALVAPPQPYRTTHGETVTAEDIDVTVRMVSMGRIHHACPVTGVACLAAACQLPGTVPAAAARNPLPEPEVRLGHPKGIARAGARVVHSERPDVEAVTVVRTARRLMDGMVYHRRGEG